jgi:hypothetical protein
MPSKPASSRDKSKAKRPPAKSVKPSTLAAAHREPKRQSPIAESGNGSFSFPNPYPMLMLPFAAFARQQAAMTRIILGAMSSPARTSVSRKRTSR